jgi:fatty acid-binding protein DegV
MLDHLAALPSPMRIGVGDADAGPVVDDLVRQLRERRPADDVVRYVVGPTVAAHAGMGTFGVVYHPLGRPTH